ncbi:hypothetical protein GCM10027299_42250 [Larkinella ripae]
MKSILFHNEVPVMTTEMLARELGVDSERLNRNFGRNKKRYEAGVHFFLLKGRALQMFRSNCPEHTVDAKAPILYLWTEKGGFNHVKSLATPESWDAFQNLIDRYFRQREALKAIVNAHADQDVERLLEHTKREKQIQNSKEVNTFNFLEGGVEKIIDHNRKNCWCHVNMLPHEVTNWAKKKGFPAKARTSAKEVFRNTKPEIASSMSFTDELCKTGKISVEDAAILSKLHALPLFAKMRELGVLQPPKAHNSLHNARKL